MWITTGVKPDFGGISPGQPCGKFRLLDVIMRYR